MRLLDITKYPEEILRKKCEPIKGITERELKLFEDMLFTMKHFGGLGLAAPQVGISERIIVADTGEDTVKLANPEIMKVKGRDKLEEGCLSIPNVKVDVTRPYEVVVRGLNVDGETIELKAKGLIARILQHEIDHLNGKLIIDYMGLLEKMKFKMRRDYERVQCQEKSKDM
jgi:peptide deformylase